MANVTAQYGGSNDDRTPSMSMPGHIKPGLSVKGTIGKAGTITPKRKRK